MNVNERIAGRLRELRATQGLSLEALAARSQVSRSNISLIERGRSSPSAAVLDRLAGALDVSLASLFEAPRAAAGEPSPLARAAEQSEWTDPESGYRRRNLSPAAPSPIQLVEVHFPPGQHVHLDGVATQADWQQQLWVLEGCMTIRVGGTQWSLQAGDCLAMHLDAPVSFHNPARTPARYLVALAVPPGSWR